MKNSEKLSLDEIKKRCILLNRKGLISSVKNKSFNDISIYDFKLSVMSTEEMEKAKLIIFVDGDKSKILKNGEDYSVKNLPKLIK